MSESDKKIVVFTCITGHYDRLRPFLNQSEETLQKVDFICFTDDEIPNASSLGWKILPIPQELDGLSNVKKQRMVKICPHKWLREYDLSVWVDGSFQICGDILDFMRQYDLDKCSLYTRIHPTRNCIYKEAEACVILGKDRRSVVERQISKYKSENYPRNIGLAETGIILRKHNDLKCQMLCNVWASEVLVGSHRDQLSFNYACWKQHFLPGCLKYEFNNITKSTNCKQTFKLNRHG